MLIDGIKMANHAVRCLYNSLYQCHTEEGLEQKGALTKIRGCGYFGLCYSGMVLVCYRVPVLATHKIPGNTYKRKTLTLMAALSSVSKSVLTATWLLNFKQNICPCC